MSAVSVYDGDLQMFVEKPRELDLEKLRFLRWMVEQGKLEHTPAGEPSGKLACLRDVDT
jgi:hypothetical protein